MSGCIPVIGLIVGGFDVLKLDVQGVWEGLHVLKLQLRGSMRVARDRNVVMWARNFAGELSLDFVEYVALRLRFCSRNIDQEHWVLDLVEILSEEPRTSCWGPRRS